SEALVACAVLHTHVARRILGLLDGAERAGTLAPGLREARKLLAALLDAHPEVRQQDAAQLAWELYRLFLSILETGKKRRGAAAAARRYDAYVSYRRAGGSHAALAIRSQLQTRGVSVFLDVEGLQAGTFDDQLLRRIEEAPCFLLILSPGSLDRCHQEGDW